MKKNNKSQTMLRFLKMLI